MAMVLVRDLWSEHATYSTANAFQKSDFVLVEIAKIKIIWTPEWAWLILDKVQNSYEL